MTTLEPLLSTARRIRLRAKLLARRVVDRAGAKAPDAAGFPAGRPSSVDLLPDDELARLNALLPWGAFVVDGRGRRFGNAYSSVKRAEPQTIPDPRIVELDRRAPLAGLHVLEIGCFEGIHTTALCERAGSVTAVDSRVENVAKTMVRCGFLGQHPTVIRVDLEEPLPAGIDLSCDVLHHVGVLYHLTDPAGHLAAFADLTRRAILLDTHVARDDADASAVSSYQAAGRSWRYQRFEESGRAAPFAGMRDHAKWMYVDDLVELLHSRGFAHVDVARRDERNGPRVTIYALR